MMKSPPVRLMVPVLLSLFPALLLTATGCDLLDPNPNAEIELRDAPTELPGRQLYALHCASCHGVDGTVSADQVLPINGFAVRASFMSALDEGPGQMPRFPQLDSAERERLFFYVRDSL